MKLFNKIRIQLIISFTLISCDVFENENLPPSDICNKISSVDSIVCETNIAEYNYCLEDINYNSCFSGQNIGKSKFNNQITLHYFGHQN